MEQFESHNEKHEKLLSEKDSLLAIVTIMGKEIIDKTKMKSCLKEICSETLFQ